MCELLWSDMFLCVSEKCWAYAFSHVSPLIDLLVLAKEERAVAEWFGNCFPFFYTYKLNRISLSHLFAFLASNPPSLFGASVFLVTGLLSSPTAYTRSEWNAGLSKPRICLPCRPVYAWKSCAVVENKRWSPWQVFRVSSALTSQRPHYAELSGLSRWVGVCGARWAKLKGNAERNARMMVWHSGKTCNVRNGLTWIS